MDDNINNEAGRNYPEARYVNEAVNIIALSYSRPLKISEIADRVGINRSYLTSIFKREMHVSPQAFLINIRLENAARLLKETEDTVGNIAAAVGYSDPLAFSKAFKQKYGCTPSEFRRTSIVLEQTSIRGIYAGSHKL
jgi:AraC-like DNA-binding protein